MKIHQIQRHEWQSILSTMLSSYWRSDMNERGEAFDRIWAKGKTNKMVQRLMSKCQLRGLEPTEENCRDYWMGYIRYYEDG
ncbi:MAG: hypothetical protein CM15mV52_0370 [uncultured marine virus]|nr:MAG: hypothetical protein CM15mV52_0370 [uncultured marine virus]